MALGFLDVLSFGAGLISSFKKKKNPPGYEQMVANSEFANKVRDALADPNNPWFKQLVGDEESRMRGDYASSLKDLRNADLRARRRGGGFLNPERADSAIAMSFAKGAQDIQTQARVNARSYLASALQANQAGFGSFAQATGVAAKTQAQNQNSRAGGLEALLRGMKTMDGSSSKMTQWPAVNVNVGNAGPYQQPFAGSNKQWGGFPTQ